MKLKEKGTCSEMDYRKGVVLRYLNYRVVELSSLGEGYNGTGSLIIYSSFFLVAEVKLE